MPIPALAAQSCPVASAAPAHQYGRLGATELNELTVADGASADIGELVASVHTRLLLLGPSGRALARISSAIEGCRPDVLHIVTHGRAGAISLGGEWIGTRELAAASGILSRWNVGAIALWSCHGGADQAFGQVLAALTGARVLVSPGALGMVDGQPHWELVDADRRPLPAHFKPPFDGAVMQAWPHQLAKLGFVDACAVNTATSGVTIVTGRDGILDCKQNNVAQLPLQSVQAHATGKNALVDDGRQRLQFRCGSLADSAQG